MNNNLKNEIPFNRSQTLDHEMSITLTTFAASKQLIDNNEVCSSIIASTYNLYGKDMFEFQLGNLGNKNEILGFKRIRFILVANEYSECTRPTRFNNDSLMITTQEMNYEDFFSEDRKGGKIKLNI